MAFKKTRGVVAAGHPQTAAAGRIMLEQGGNAFDAAIASVLTACVTESTLTSLGGGGFLLAHTAQGDSCLFDFFCQTPKTPLSLDAVDFYPVTLNFGGALQTFHIGKGAIAVPGMVAGIFAAHRRLGRLPFSILIEPAIEAARRGFTVNAFNAYTYRLLEPILRQEAESERFYAPDGERLREGEQARLPQFAEFLEQLARYGPDWFYQGELAHHALDYLQVGSALTPTDWSDYRVERRSPLKTTYRHYQLLTNPPPSSGGILIAFALKLLESVNLSDYPLGSPSQIQLFSRVMALTNQARRQELDSFLHQADIDQRFLNGDRHLDYRDQLEQHLTHLNHLNKLGSTTHISVLDEDGNAASLTSSNGEGSGCVIPETGIMLNNMLGEADLNPQGFYRWRPQQRLSSMMSPSLVLASGMPKLVLGSGGSNRIRSAILQVICHCLDYQLPLTPAIAHSRLHWEAQQLDLEPNADPHILDTLSFDDGTQATHWTEHNMFFGGVHGVELQADGQLQGAGDPRRTGSVEYCL